MSKMNSRTSCVTSEFSFETNMLSKIKTKQGDFFDGRYLTKPVDGVRDGEAIIELSKITSKNEQKTKLKLNVDTKTGKIILAEKSPFTSWKTSLKRVERLMDNMLANFDNKEIVEHFSTKMNGFTQKGIERFQAAAEKVYKK